MARPPLLVLGSNSYSAAAFIDLALERHDVIGLSRSSPPHDALRPYLWHGTRHRGALRLVRARLGDQRRLEALLADAQPEYIFNFAAQSMVAESWACPEHWYATNVVETARAAAVALRLKRLKRWVQVSTPEVYGQNTGNLTEDTRLNPSTPYAISKAACDWHLLALHRHARLPVVFTRAANVYGPGQPLYRILPKAAYLALTGGKLPLDGGGSSQRAFIHGRDMSAGTWLAATRGRTGEVYHLSPGNELPIQAAVEMVCRAAGVAPEALIQPAPERPAKDARYQLDSTKARTELGWEPKVLLEQDIEEILAWVRQNLAALRRLPREYRHRR